MHYRGASFDLVNPHHSLKLEDIHTPEPRRRSSDVSDFFDPTVDALTALTADMSPARDDPSSPVLEGSTPSRGELFDDFPSAHQAIVSRLRPSEGTPDREPAERVTNVLPHSAPGLTGYSTLTSNENLPSSSKSKHPGLKQRLSNVFRNFRGSDSFTAMERAVAAQGGELATLPEQRAIAGQGIPSTSAPAGLPSLTEDVAYNHPDTEPTMGRIGLEIDRTAPDDASTYSTAYSFGDYPESIVDNRRSIPYGRQVGETDYSSEVDISSYAYEFGASPTRRGHLSGLRTSSQKDATLQNIYDHYRSSTDPNLSVRVQDPVSPVDEEGIELSTFQSSSSLHNTYRTHPSSQGSSHADSPKTPESNVFHTPGGHVIYSSPSVPPNIPLPPINQMPSLQQRANFIPSGISSTGESYGDTRNLLLMSQGFSEAGPANASSSSQALPNVQEDDRLSPQTAFRPSPPPRSPMRLASFQGSFDTQGSFGTVPSGRVSAATVSCPTTAFSNFHPMTPEIFDSDGQPLTPRPLRPLRQITEAGPSHGELPRGALAPSPDCPTSPHSVKSSGVPAMWRSRSPGFLARAEIPVGESSGDSIADYDDEDVDADWETVADPSRATLPAENTMSSIADYSDASRPDSGVLPAGYYSGNNHESRNYSEIPNVLHSGLAPQPLFDNCQQLPHQLPGPSNVQVPPTTQEQSDKPRPTEQTEDDDDKDHLPRMSEDWKFSLKLLDLHQQHIEEAQQQLRQPAETSISWPQTPENNSWSTENLLKPDASAFAAGTTLEHLMAAGPNDEIVYESPNLVTRSGNVMSSAPTSPTHDLSSSPAFASSPLPEQDREDSFAKLTQLSDKANLTGTPNGTGMNEAGSSLANTSSPGGMNFSSTPLRTPNFASSPLANELEFTPMNDEQDAHDNSVISGITSVSPSAGRNRTVLALSPTSTAYESENMPTPTAPAFPREQIETGNIADLRTMRTHEHNQRSVTSPVFPTMPRQKSKRASVQGQVGLRDLRLVSQNRENLSPVEPATPPQARINRGISVSTIQTNVSQTMRNAGSSAGAVENDPRNNSFDTTSPLVGYNRPELRVLSQDEIDLRHLLREQASALHPRLYNIPRQLAINASPALRKRQYRISWALYWLCIPFPPFMLVLRYRGDEIITMWTNGKIDALYPLVKDLSIMSSVAVFVIMLIAIMITIFVNL